VNLVSPTLKSSKIEWKGIYLGYKSTVLPLRDPGFNQMIR